MIVAVHVKPGSRSGPRVETDHDGRLIVYVREPATEGRANRAAIGLLAKHFRVPRSRVELVTGATARVKRFRIDRGDD